MRVPFFSSIVTVSFVHFIRNLADISMSFNPTYALFAHRTSFMLKVGACLALYALMLRLFQRFDAVEIRALTR
jgi:hypothetical protein